MLGYGVVFSHHTHTLSLSSRLTERWFMLVRSTGHKLTQLTRAGSPADLNHGPVLSRSDAVHAPLPAMRKEFVRDGLADETGEL